MFKKIAILLFLILRLTIGDAHQISTSVFILNLKSNYIEAELLLPLGDLEIAFGKRLTLHPEISIKAFQHELSSYITSHIHPLSDDGETWKVELKQLKLEKSNQIVSEIHWTLVASLVLQPPPMHSNRKFTLNYDLILHSLMFHKTLVSVRHDWENGQVENRETALGVISLDVKKGTIAPLRINLNKGSNWLGFKSMVKLGIQHIAEGIDHLLFLLVLLLPATLLVESRRWAAYGGIKFSLIRLLKITSAFTIGHSITLIFGALGWLKLPQQPIEILIAVTILITAIHAYRPIFVNKEVYIAGGFGLIHGTAFASALTDLNLEAGKMALSILGFNIGIELMQIFVIVIVIPWMIILSLNPYYKWFRIGGAVFAMIAALAWIAERSLLKANFISAFVQKAADKSLWLVASLAIAALLSLGFKYLK